MEKGGADPSLANDFSTARAGSAAGEKRLNFLFGISSLLADVKCGAELGAFTDVVMTGEGVQNVDDFCDVVVVVVGVVVVVVVVSDMSDVAGDVVGFFVKGLTLFFENSGVEDPPKANIPPLLGLSVSSGVGGVGVNTDAEGESLVLNLSNGDSTFPKVAGFDSALNAPKLEDAWIVSRVDDDFTVPPVPTGLTFSVSGVDVTLKLPNIEVTLAVVVVEAPLAVTGFGSPTRKRKRK